MLRHLTSLCSAIGFVLVSASACGSPDEVLFTSTSPDGRSKAELIHRTQFPGFHTGWLRIEGPDGHLVGELCIIPDGDQDVDIAGNLVGLEWTDRELVVRTTGRRDRFPNGIVVRVEANP